MEPMAITQEEAELHLARWREQRTWIRFHYHTEISTKHMSYHGHCLIRDHGTQLRIWDGRQQPLFEATFNLGIGGRWQYVELGSISEQAITNNYVRQFVGSQTPIMNFVWPNLDVLCFLPLEGLDLGTTKKGD